MCYNIRNYRNDRNMRQEYKPKKILQTEHLEPKLTNSNNNNISSKK
jgi:hypothetical protein